MPARLALLLGLALTARAASAVDPLRLDALDEPTPAFSLPAAGGQAPYDSQRPHERPVLLHFWATWCVPCRRELPQLAALARAEAPHVDLVLIAVDEEASPQAIARFAHDSGVDLPVYVAGSRAETRAFWQWGVPATYLQSPAGQLRGRLLGPRDWADDATKTALLAALRALAPGSTVATSSPIATPRAP